ncbi:hypothetical protein GGX14DRAFT_568178 [Mycena pura]|uniref:F-box domain-containing protein n=1 Tax=Mycena pura TaxID=153505 RepID=A0AAD6V9N4_9AGAR|nr:hypothetical protein GGX14DRAFT_568178 [Mycena pura]
MAWRQIALDTPPLWSHIVFKSRAWMNTCLERSTTSLLVVAADIRLALVETLVCDVLKMPDRIARIHLKFSVPSQRVVDLLPGPFPHLTHLSIEHDTWEVSNIPVKPDVPPFPALRSLFLRTNVSYLPPLPSQLVSLEIYYTGWGLVPWDSFAPALCQLQQLHELKLSGFSDPPSSYARQIPLPVLRDLHVSGSPKHCTQFIEALDSPKLRRFNLHLSNFDNLPALHRTVSLRMPKPPKCMMIDRDNGCTAGGNDFLLSTPFAANVHCTTVSMTFIYANERWPRDAALDVCLSWIVPSGVHGDPALATIFAALSEFVWLEHLERLGFYNWSGISAALWRPFLDRLAGLRTLTVNDSPPAGLFWALLRDLESMHDVSASGAEEVGTDSGGCALLPAMQTIKIIGVNCGAGSWLPHPRRPAALPTHSYFDLDNTRFLELLICYLELRPSPLTKLVVEECFGYTGAGEAAAAASGECALGRVGYDGGQKGYEALNMSDEERWHEEAVILWE